MKEVTLRDLINKAKKFNQIAEEFKINERLEILLEVEYDRMYTVSLKELKSRLKDTGWEDFYSVMIEKKLTETGDNRYELCIHNYYMEVWVKVSIWMEERWEYEYNHDKI